MAELSEVKKRVAKKIEEVMHRTYDPLILADAVIPLAQLQWDKPTKEEIQHLLDMRTSSLGDMLREFISCRTDDPRPQPVDPRREAVRRVLWKAATIEQKLDEIFAAFDEVK